MKKYIVDEQMLIHLLVKEMRCDTVCWDLVDNFYGIPISDSKILKEYAPKGMKITKDTDFYEVAKARLLSGEFEEHE